MRQVLTCLVGSKLGHLLTRPGLQGTRPENSILAIPYRTTLFAGRHIIMISPNLPQLPGWPAALRLAGADRCGRTALFFSPRLTRTSPLHVQSLSRVSYPSQEFGQRDIAMVRKLAIFLSAATILLAIVGAGSQARADQAPTAGLRTTGDWIAAETW